jgi:hypothetical protein
MLLHFVACYQYTHVEQNLELHVENFSVVRLMTLFGSHPSDSQPLPLKDVLIHGKRYEPVCRYHSAVVVVHRRLVYL